MREAGKQRAFLCPYKHSSEEKRAGSMQCLEGGWEKDVGM